MGPFEVLAGVGIAFALVLFTTIKNMLQVCTPSEVLIISGNTSRIGERTVGYRWVKGGSTFKWPVIERLHHIDLRNITIDVAVKNAYSKGGVPLTVEGVASVKICGDQPMLNQAVERFLALPRDHIIQIAKETLEGNLRGVLATLTPEEVNADKMRFAQSLVEEADKDLHRLGLTLDNLKVQNVHDDVGYLNCIGRKKRAEQLMANRIAEAENKMQAAVREAENREATVLIEVENRMKIVKAEAETKIADARTRRSAVVAEEKSKVAKEIAKAEAEIGVYKAIIEQTRHKLQADVLAPAEAYRCKAVSEAQAKMAPIRETGRATAEMIASVHAAWSKAGPAAREIFVMQKMDRLIDTMVSTMPEVNVDRLTVVGQSAGGGNFMPQMMAAAEALRGAFTQPAAAAAPAPARAQDPILAELMRPPVAAAPAPVPVAVREEVVTITEDPTPRGRQQPPNQRRR